MYLTRTGALLLCIYGLSNSPSALSQETSFPLLEQIEIEGVSAFKADEIEDALGVFPGDRVAADDVTRGTENLRNLYHSKGYRDVRVTATFNKLPNRNATQPVVLKYIVVEGQLTLISRVTVNAPEMKDQVARKDWRRLQAQFLAQLKGISGKPCEQERLAEITRQIESIFSGENYIGSRIREVKYIPEPAPEKKQGQWVEVRILVELGSRVTFGFRGNQVLARNELNDVLSSQKEIGLGMDSLKALEQAISDKYKSMGHAHVAVQSLPFDDPSRQERHVTFLIQEGPLVRPGEIEFEGNFAFESTELSETFKKHIHKYYVRKDTEKAADELINWLKSRGYLSAKIVSVNEFFEEKGSRARIVVFLYEGEQTVVRRIVLNGNQKFGREAILETLQLEEGEPLNLFAFSAGLEELRDAYRQRGYLDIRILDENGNEVVQYSAKNRLADIELRIQEGPEYRVGTITIEGLTRTREDVVRREVVLDESAVLDVTKVAESESNLRKLGIFSKVQIRSEDEAGRPGFKKVTISLEEAGRIRLGGGVGFRNDLGIRLFSELAYTNLWKRDHTWSLTGNVNRRLEKFDITNPEYEIRMTYKWPWFLGSQVLFQPEATLERRQLPKFNLDTRGLSTNFERRVWLEWNLVAGIGYTIEYNRMYSASSDRSIRIGSISPNLRVDQRDNPLSPTRGYFTSAVFELALPGFGSQSEPYPVGYSRIQVRADGFIPLPKRLIWLVSFRTGFERNLIDPVDYPGPYQKQIGIPISKQFALGGPGSLRGFELQELNAQNMTIAGTLSYVNYRTQLEIPLTDTLKLGPFVDAGNLMVDSFSLGNLRYGVGFGVHYQTPVGPVNFDLGFKIAPKPWEKYPSLFHFTVGMP